MLKQADKEDGKTRAVAAELPAKVAAGLGAMVTAAVYDLDSLKKVCVPARD